MGELQSRAWRHDYVDQIPPDAHAALNPAETAQRWAAVTHGQTPTAVLVAVDTDQVCGFLAFDVRAESVHVLVLVIDPEFRGRGHASRLMSALADHALQAGAPEAVMWCPAADQALQGFLRSCGWGPDGATRTLADESMRAEEVRYVTSFIGGSPAPAGT